MNTTVIDLGQARSRREDECWSLRFQLGLFLVSRRQYVAEAAALHPLMNLAGPEADAARARAPDLHMQWQLNERIIDRLARRLAQLKRNAPPSPDTISDHQRSRRNAK